MFSLVSNQMQIKITLRYHYTISLVKIKMSDADGVKLVNVGLESSTSVEG